MPRFVDPASLSDEPTGGLQDEGDVLGLEAVDQVVEFVGLWRGLDAEPGCLAFEESLLLGFDDRGIGFDGGVGWSLSSCEACFGRGVQLVGLEFEPFGEDVEDLGRGDLAPFSIAER